MINAFCCYLVLIVLCPDEVFLVLTNPLLLCVSAPTTQQWLFVGSCTSVCVCACVRALTAYVLFWLRTSSC